MSCNIKTNWYVITGGPCSGKTTLVNGLNEKGYKTTIERARHYIDTQKEQGRTVEEIRSNQLAFQREVLALQIRQERMLNPDEPVFLDRALPDALAYYHFLNLEITASVMKAVQLFCYKKVFILDRLPLINDYARREDAEEQVRIHNLLIQVYENRPCEKVYVPVLPHEERINYVVERM